jgi:hypothetical protein
MPQCESSFIFANYNQTCAESQLSLIKNHSSCFLLLLGRDNALLYGRMRQLPQPTLFLTASEVDVPLPPRRRIKKEARTSTTLAVAVLAL